MEGNRSYAGTTLFSNGNSYFALPLLGGCECNAMLHILFDYRVFFNEMFHDIFQNLELIRDARSAKGYQDELDIVREKVHLKSNLCQLLPRCTICNAVVLVYSFYW